MELYQAYLKVLLVFPLILILAYCGLRFFLGRFAPALGMGRRLQVLERTALNSRTFLFVVKAGEEYLLIGTSANTVVLLKDLGRDWEKDYGGEKGETLWPEQKRPLSFAPILQRLRSKERDDSQQFSREADGIKKLFIRGKKQKIWGNKKRNLPI